jgi:hypothetical protein
VEQPFQERRGKGGAAPCAVQEAWWPGGGGEDKSEGMVSVFGGPARQRMDRVRR